MYTVLDGRKIANDIKAELKIEADELNRYGRRPILGVIHVKGNSASETYVRNKRRVCEQIGISFWEVQRDKKVTETQLLQDIKDLKDMGCSGIFVQLPLPVHINTETIINAIPVDKDVDGFHPLNMGTLAIGKPNFISCTPLGVVELLHRYGIEIAGKNCVVVGRSNEVGKPMAMLLLQKNGTVTVCHSKTKNLKEITSKADILVIAIGKDRFITEEYVKEGAVVIDVGINRDKDGKLHGDVDFDNVAEKCGFITPVPGGVGQMTVAMLMKNCIKAEKMRGVSL